MKKLAMLLVCLGLCGLAPALADVIYVSGDVSGTWSADTVIVTAEVRVPPGDTLVIEPGVKVLFWTYDKFIVDTDAVLRAVGTVNDTIRFDEYSLGNRWHGIRFLNASDSSRLEYCHLKHGLATGSGEDTKGGAIYCSSSSPTIRNCLIDSCEANSPGGGIYCTSSSPMIDSTTISGNSATVGGGIYCNNYSRPTISGNTISGDSAYYGGGICCNNYSHPTISGNTISGNTAYYGGGISCNDFSRPTITGNTISGNSATYGGGIYCYFYSRPTITGNTISGNSGIGIYCENYTPAISGNTISGNSGPGIYCYISNPTISGNTISGNSGPGIYCYVSNPTISGNTISGNSGGGICCYDYSRPTITGNTISGNSANYGGGIYCYDNSNPTITGNTVSGNSATNGGGIYCYNNSNPTITGNTISGNSATDGGGIYCSGSAPSVDLNEISQNTASGDGGGIYLSSSSPAMNKNTIVDNTAATGGGLYCTASSPTLQNCILWGNTAQTSPMIYQTGGSNAQVTYSDLQDFGSGTTNIFDYPLFVDPVHRDYHLQIGPPCSPCIDKGDPASPGDPDSTIADMGAYWRDRGYRPPSAFSLISPHYDTCWTSGTLLVWHAAYDTNTNDTVSYEVWLDTLANLSTRWEVASELSDTIFTLGGLADDYTYYWIVHASDLNTLGRWALRGLAFRTYFPEPPTGFALLEPADSLQLPFGEVHFCWQAAHDPDPHDAPTYTLHLSTNDTSLSYAADSDTCRALDIGALGLGDDVIVEWWVEAHSTFPDTTVESALRFHFHPPSAVSGEDALLPTEFALYQNYPNPFNPITTIRYDVPTTGKVSLAIFNLLGQEVTRLVDERQLAGSYTVFWNAANWPSGVYLCQMEAGGFVQTRKMLLVK